jgi:membrane-associated phospholipid phosphatase
MNERARSLLPLAAAILGCLAIVFCYFFVDRQVAWFVHDHRFCSEEARRWPAMVSEWLNYPAIAAIAIVAAWRLWRPGGRAQALLVAIAVGAVATNVIKTLLKGLFGRTWPDSWMGDNPSLIDNGVYGFFPCHFFDPAYGSFPSGHASVALALLSILWLSLPRWRVLFALIGIAICASLIVLNFHFVGDVLAGAMLGTFTGCITVRVFRLRPDDQAVSK